MNELPEGWVWKKLGEVCEIIMGQSPPSDTYNDNGKGLPFFQGKAEFTELYPLVRKWCNSPNKIAEPDDILLSVRAPVGTTNIANQKCCIGRGLAAIRYENYKFVFYFLRSIEQELDKKGTGTTFRAISGETIRTTDLPPLPVQHAIVTKIEEIFSELDHGVEQLKTARAQLKVYRQAVLKWAFEGRLTEADIVEGELPAGWKVEQLSRVCKFSQGIQVPIGNQKIDPFPGSVRFLRIIDFTQGDDPPRYIENPGEKYLLKKDEIAMVRYGTVGFVCTGKEGIIANNLFKIVPVESLTKKYLIHFLKSHLFMGKLETKGATMQALSFGLINPIPIPLPPLSEQHQIVSEIERRLSVCDKLEETIEAGLKQAEVLRAGVLKMAFEGRLVGS